jgi:hypothetical protein
MHGTRLIPRCRNSSECCPDKFRWEHMKLPTMSVAKGDRRELTRASELPQPVASCCSANGRYGEDVRKWHFSEVALWSAKRVKADAPRKRSRIVTQSGPFECPRSACDSSGDLGRRARPPSALLVRQLTGDRTGLKATCCPPRVRRCGFMDRGHHLTAGWSIGSDRAPRTLSGAES